jgi:hypothetical protein
MQVFGNAHGTAVVGFVAAPPGRGAGGAWATTLDFGLSSTTLAATELEGNPCGFCKVITSSLGSSSIKLVA